MSASGPTETTASNTKQPPTALYGYGGMFLAGLILFVLALVGGVWQWRAALTARQDPMFGKSDNELWAEAFKLADQGLFDQAHSIAQRADTQDLAPVLNWIDYRSGKSSATLAQIDEFVGAYSDFPGIQLVEIARQSLLKQSLPDDEMLAYYAEHPPVNFAAQLHRLEVMARGSDTLSDALADEAIETARLYWRSRTLRPADQQALFNAFGEHLSVEDHLGRLDHLMTHGARNSGQRLIQYLPERWKPLAQAWADNNANGQDLPARFKQHPVFVVPQVLEHDENDNLDAALAALESIPHSLRLPKLEWRARLIVVRELIESQRFDEAYRVALNHGLFAQDGKQDDAVAEANWMSGWIALSRMGLTFSAQQSFEMALESAQSANWRAQASYWLGLTYEAQRQGELARQTFSTCAQLVHTYYGQLCTAQLDRSLFEDGLPIAIASTGANTSDTLAGFAQNDHEALLKATAALLDIDRHSDATKFLYRLGGLAQSTQDIGILGNLANENDLGRTALGLSWIAADRELVELSAMLPVLEAQLLSPVSLELALLHAIASRESVFVVDAVSPKGALGLMQVLPATGERMARKLGLEWNEQQMLTDPSYNFTVGAAYLDQLAQRFDGNLLLAIASYNAGPGNVDRWIAEFGDPGSSGVDAGIWVESIPFRETRNYVKDVVARYNLYRAFMANQPVTVFTSDYLSRI